MDVLFIVCLAVAFGLYSEYRYRCGVRDMETHIEEIVKETCEGEKHSWKVAGASNLMRNLEMQGLIVFHDDGTIIGKDNKVFDVAKLMESKKLNTSP